MRRTGTASSACAGVGLPKEIMIDRLTWLVQVEGQNRGGFFSTHPATGAHGGIGSGESPKTALSVGLKVDVDALPKDLQGQLKAGKVDLDDPATTIEKLTLWQLIWYKIFQVQSESLQSAWQSIPPCMT
jgi:hypothetical protein